MTNKHQPEHTVTRDEVNEWLRAIKGVQAISIDLLPPSATRDPIQAAARLLITAACDFAQTAGRPRADLDEMLARMWAAGERAGKFDA
jgi:hypothetical protein